VSAFGDGGVAVAMAYAVLGIHGSATDVGTVLGASLASQLLFVAAGGVWGDRLSRRAVMLTADVVRALVQATLAVLLLSGHARVGYLVIGAIVYGAAASFFRPAAIGLVAEVVPAERLQSANALLSMSRSACKIGGPAVAGIVIVLSSAGWMYAVDALSFVVSAVSLAMLRLAPRTLPPRQSFLRDLAVGWREVTRRRWYWVNLCAHGVWNIAIGAYYVLGPLVAQRALGGAAAWGAIQAAVPVGGLLGAAAALRLRPRRPLVAGNLALALALPLILGLAGPAPVYVLVACAAVGFAGPAFMNQVWASVMQQLMPAEALARVGAYDWTVSFIATPIGFPVAGVLADAVGVRFTLVGAAVLMAASTLVVLLPDLRAVRAEQGSLVQSTPS
jgi:MFS family permease